MKALWMLALVMVLALGLAAAACGSDGKSVCDEAWEIWCACPSVTCDGHPSSCTGPDREWAECVLAAADPCEAGGSCL